jgi:hypothetical protein
MHLTGDKPTHPGVDNLGCRDPVLSQPGEGGRLGQSVGCHLLAQTRSYGLRRQLSAPP